VPETVDTDDVRRLAEHGAQLVEVLPEKEYSVEHLPGAVNIPLARLDRRSVAGLDPALPTVVYCYDHECDLSARGAHLLEALGFTDVHDYVASKTAWMAGGLPVEGDTPDSARAGSIARPVPTHALGGTVGDLAGGFAEDGICVITGAHEVVLGVVREEASLLPPQTPIADVLITGPQSVRPSITAPELARSMQQDGRSYVLVTHYDGVLVGIIRPDDLHGQH
jgi:rhodanese-related sulfurtransferase